MTAPARVLELVGLPGAGKTTTAPLVIEELRGRGFAPLTVSEAIDAAVARSTRGRLLRILGVRPPYRRRTRALLVEAPAALALPIVAPRLALALIDALRRLPVPAGHRAAIARRALRVVAAQRFVRPRLRAGEAVVIDEGPVHRVVNLYAWRPSTPAGSIRGYLDAAPLPDAVLEVRVPTAEAVARLRAREAGLPERLRGADDARLRRFVERADAALAASREHLAARVAWTTLSSADGEGDIGRALDELGFTRADVSGGPLASPHYRPLLGVSIGRPGRRDADRRRPVDGMAIPTVARDAWALDPSRAHAVGRGGRSDTVLVTSAVAGRVIVKRYKASVDPQSVDSEHLVLEALAAHAFPAPRPVPAADGSLVVCDGEGRRWAAFEVIDGRPLHALVGLPGDRGRSAFLAGATLGALHTALAGIETPYQPETGFRSMTGPRVREIGSYLDLLALEGAPDGAASTARSRSWARARLAALDAGLAADDPARGLIHGDYGPYNLLVRRGARVAVIDFELARLDWLVTDLATAIPRFAAGRLRFSNGAARAFVDGYRSRHALPDGELAAIPDVASFLALRRAAVAWGRHVESGEHAWRAEAIEKLDLAQAIADGHHGLVRLVGAAR